MDLILRVLSSNNRGIVKESYCSDGNFENIETQFSKFKTIWKRRYL